MAIDRRTGKNLPKHVDRAATPGIRFDSGPYVGIVKSAVDSTRTGRLQVYIPELGGDNPDDPKFWRTVSYASPFGGATRNPSGPQANAFGTTNTSYGFWMVPPDVGNQVLCIFAGGDPGRGYWFACVNPDLSQHMVPAIGSSERFDPNAVPPQLQGVIKEGQRLSLQPPRYPVAEFNLNNPAAYNEAFFNNFKPLHVPHFNSLIAQGLQNDPIRGSIGSSAQRESPSSVFGFSSPGRPYGTDPGDDPTLIQKIVKNNVNLGDLRVVLRKGGHSLVMDDGDIRGNDQLIRLRTAAGHQIIMHDPSRKSSQTVYSPNIAGIDSNLDINTSSIYVSTAGGTAWLELTGSGQVLIYSGNDVAIRAKGSLNLHADRNILMNAGGSIKMWAKGPMAVEAASMAMTGHQGISMKGMSISATATASFSASGATASVSGVAKASFGSGGKTTLGGSVTTISGGLINLMGGKAGGAVAGAVGKAGSTLLGGGSGVQQNNFPDTSFAENAGWVANPNMLKSVVRILPTHEPYARNIEPEAVPAVNVDANGNPILSETITSTAGPSGAKNKGVTGGAPTSSIISQPDPAGGIGNLTSDEVKAYMAQVGYSESRGDYNAVNQYGYLGKYQMGAGALIDGGYVKPGTTQSGLSNPANWTGKDGIASSTDFLNNSAIQETQMYNYTVNNYNRLRANGVITSDSGSSDMAGYLSVAHLLGAGGAKTWYTGGGGADANGTTGDTYYNRGRYSQEVLLASVQHPSGTA